MNEDFKKANQVIGYIPLSPALISVLLFMYRLIMRGEDVLEKWFSSSVWSGYYGDTGGYSSALPLYFGLMALAGGYLIKEKN